AMPEDVGTWAQQWCVYRNLMAALAKPRSQVDGHDLGAGPAAHGAIRGQDSHSSTAPPATSIGHYSGRAKMPEAGAAAPAGSSGRRELRPPVDRVGPLLERGRKARERSVE